MTPDFADPAARRRWDGYFAEVDRLLRHRPADAAELRAGLVAHAFDAMAAAPDGSERERLEAALARLGRPGDYLPPAVGDGPGARGRLSAARRAARAAAAWLALALGYPLLAILAAAAALKPLWGDHVGLFRAADGTVSAGIVPPPPGARELLGWWSIPLALALAMALHVGLAGARRAVRRTR